MYLLSPQANHDSTVLILPEHIWVTTGGRQLCLGVPGVTWFLFLVWTCHRLDVTTINYMLTCVLKGPKQVKVKVKLNVLKEF